MCPNGLASILHICVDMKLWESVEDITGSDMNTLTISKPKVQPFYMNFIFDRFNELMLHIEVCTFPFLELITWIKERFDCIWKAWKVNEFDWDQAQVFLMSSTRPPHHFWPKERKGPNPTFFGCCIKTAEQHQLATVTMASYGIRMGHSSTS